MHPHPWVTKWETLNDKECDRKPAQPAASRQNETSTQHLVKGPVDGRPPDAGVLNHIRDRKRRRKFCRLCPREVQAEGRRRRAGGMYVYVLCRLLDCGRQLAHPAMFGADCTAVAAAPAAASLNVLGREEPIQVGVYEPASRMLSSHAKLIAGAATSQANQDSNANMLAAARDSPLAGFQAGRVAQNDGEALPSMRPWTIRIRRKVEEPLPQELVCRLLRTRTANIKVSAADRPQVCSLVLHMQHMQHADVSNVRNGIVHTLTSMPHGSLPWTQTVMSSRSPLPTVVAPFTFGRAISQRGCCGLRGSRASFAII